MINFLESWEKYLLVRLEKIKIVEDIGYLYEEFVSQDEVIRKAGGVYYTPQYIVNEIVKQTIGKKIAGKTPKEIEDLSILDPSCGSGSFLLGAYQFLLDWYLNYYYQQKLAKSKDKTYGQNYENVLTQDDKLRTEEKKQILLAHIYGVDIDLQAVEVTKLSLALKAMEGETVATINTQLKFFKRRVLPNLDNNVQCGNSLISPDFDKIDMFSTKKQRKINVLNWSDVFKKVIKSGGFHCVIGNPPYRMLQLGKKQESENVDILAYYKIHYPHSFSYKVNLFALFMERMLKTLRKEGSFAFIIPNAFLNSFYYKDLRKLLLEKGGFERIYDLRYRVFEEAEVGGNVMFVYKKEEKIKQTTFLKIDNLLQNLEPEISIIQHHEFLQSATYNLNIGSADLKFDTKIRNLLNVVNLGDLAIIYQGVITGDNKKFIANEQKSEEWRKIYVAEI